MHKFKKIFFYIILLFFIIIALFSFGSDSKINEINWNSYTSHKNSDPLLEDLNIILNNATKYAVNDWYNEKWNLDIQENKDFLDFTLSAEDIDGIDVTNNEHVYRQPSSQAFLLSVALVTGAYDENYTNVSKDRATDLATKLATSVAYSHVSNKGQYKSWGNEWQSALWAYYTGLSAWYLWDYIDEDSQDLIINMVEFEANRFLEQEPKYWRNFNETENFSGDSKIEENAWNGEIMLLASHMLEGHENASKWYEKYLEFQIAAFSSPQDIDNQKKLHGKPIYEWVDGYNIKSNGAVVNHDIIHPIYIATSDGVNPSLVTSPANKDIPYGSVYNLNLLYSSLTDLKFIPGTVPDGTEYKVKEPGGTIYKEIIANNDHTKPDSYPVIYYPQSSDWGSDIFDVFLNLDISVYIYSNGKREDAYDFARYHAQQIIYQQQRFDDGHTYLDDSENNFHGREEALSSRIAQSYMSYWLYLQTPHSIHNNPPQN